MHLTNNVNIHMPPVCAGSCATTAEMCVLYMLG